MRIVQEEIFGPVITVEVFQSDGLAAFLKVKFEIYGLEMKEKQVKANKKGRRVSGRVYLALSWIGHKVKINRE